MTQIAKPPIEFRRASVQSMNFEERVATIRLVPYGEEAVIEYRGELWEESFLPGAFKGIETRQDTIRANRDHDKSKTMGKAIRFFPDQEDGFDVEVRFAETPLGEESLILAADDMLSVSAGFGVRGSDQILKRPKRIIQRAFLDHIAFVESPAYAGARVLAVRGEDVQPEAVELPPLNTPNIDEVVAWLQARS